MAYLYLDALGLGALQASLQLSVVVISGFTAAVSAQHYAWAKLMWNRSSWESLSLDFPLELSLAVYVVCRCEQSHHFAMISPDILVSVSSLWQSGS
jgi:hypothetical protein